MLSVLLCGIAMIAAAIKFDAPLWVLVPALAVFFIGLMWIAVRDANAIGLGQNYCGGGN